MACICVRMQRGVNSDKGAPAQDPGLEGGHYFPSRGICAKVPPPLFGGQQGLYTPQKVSPRRPRPDQDRDLWFSIDVEF